MAAPLARTNEILIMSGDNSRMNGEVTRLLAELPVTVNALTGVDMMKVTPPTYPFIYLLSHDMMKETPLMYPFIYLLSHDMTK